MSYEFHIVDVFAQRRFAGNQLAVVPDAKGLCDQQMQNIAREFNFSETTFVLPPRNPAHRARVRIFTPDQELPFAGHPNLGTAFVLTRTAAQTAMTRNRGLDEILLFEEGAGNVAVRVCDQPGQPNYCELTAPQAPELGEVCDQQHEIRDLAKALSIAPESVLTRTHPPRRASVGLAFLCLELDSRQTLAQAQIDPMLWRTIADRLL